MSGKGTRPRPYSVDQKTFDANWDKIFNRSNNQPQTAVDTEETEMYSPEILDQSRHEADKGC